MLFRNGELSADYNGPREAAGITKYMRAQVDRQINRKLERQIRREAAGITKYMKAQVDR